MCFHLFNSPFFPISIPSTFSPAPSPKHTIADPSIHPSKSLSSLTNPLTVQDVLEIRSTPRPHHDAGLRADPKKPNLFAAAESITDVTKHIGTEIVGLRLDELTDAQKDELALLVAERGVVFLRGQEGLSPKVQRDLGEWWGEVEVHVCAVFFFVIFYDHRFELGCWKGRVEESGKVDG